MRYVIPLLIIIVLAACGLDDTQPDIPDDETPDTPPVIVPEPDDYRLGPVEFGQSVQGFSYSFIYVKPNPCVELTIEERVRESFPVQIDIVIERFQPDGMCIQVLDEERIEGYIADRVGSVRIIEDDEVLYEEFFPLDPFMEQVDFSVEYDGAVIDYRFIVQTPTPCHEHVVSASVEDGVAKIDVRFIAPPPETACIMMIEYREIEGSFEARDVSEAVLIVEGVRVARAEV